MSTNGKRPTHQWDGEKAQSPQIALIFVPEFPGKLAPDTDLDDVDSDAPLLRRSIEARMEEAAGLARAIKLEVADVFPVTIRKVRPSTLLGKGKLEEFAELVKAHEADLVIVDHSISPVQQQNLEKSLNTKVLDRTALILEIFGARAQTREGRVQVELAHLNYQKGRLVRTWTHLERQRGGLGFVGGPGETQIEADRRMIRERITRLEIQLEKIKQTRTLHRAKRRKVPYPIVALVGYTNAGKSTLFNRLTGADVFAEDLLFATLDPTLRQLQLPNGAKIILSDTVGFVSNLPTHLIAAFRATLEEVIEADIVLHVRDISDPDHEIQAREVYSILSQLGVGESDREKIIEVWNKTDLLNTEQLENLEKLREREADGPIMLSAQTGRGTERLLELVEQKLAGKEVALDITLSGETMHHISWIYENATVQSRTNNEDGTISLNVRVNSATRAQLKRQGINSVASKTS